MSYSIAELAADCKAALKQNPGPEGREKVSTFVSKACLDADFVTKYLGDDNESERTILYEDPDMKFCILAHVYKEPKSSSPHDHASSWAIYAQVKGVTHMTDWTCVEKPKNGSSGKVRKKSQYDLTPGIAHVYNEGDLHSPERRSETRLIRVEGMNMQGVKRDKYEAVE